MGVDVWFSNSKLLEWQNTPVHTELSEFSCNFYSTEHVWVHPRVKYALYGNAVMWKCIFSSLSGVHKAYQILSISLAQSPAFKGLNWLQPFTIVTVISLTELCSAYLCQEKHSNRLVGYPCGLWPFWNLTYAGVCISFLWIVISCYTIRRWMDA